MWSNGLIWAASPSGLVCTTSSKPISSAIRFRKAIISENFQVVSMCSNGKGIGPGWNALRARCSSTELSLPIEYSIAGLLNCARTSRMMWMLSSSRRCSRSRAPSIVAAGPEAARALAVADTAGRLPAAGGSLEVVGLVT